MNKKASIVIRCLNENNNLKTLLPILLQQSYKNFEIIFVDSGSTDGSLETITNYLEKNTNIKLFHIKKDFTFGRSLILVFQKLMENILFH